MLIQCCWTYKLSVILEKSLMFSLKGDSTMIATLPMLNMSAYDTYKETKMFVPTLFVDFKLEVKMSFSYRIDKQIITYSFNGILYV